MNSNWTVSEQKEEEEGAEIETESKAKHPLGRQEVKSSKKEKRSFSSAIQC